MLTILLPSVAVGFPTLKTFGTGRSAFTLGPDEMTVFEYNVSSASAYGVMTHFWITGDPTLGSGTDNATVRYFVDNERSASVEFKPPMAAGVGFDDNTVWGNSKIGHASNRGGWYVNIKIPFQSTIRVTLTQPGGTAACFVILRGCENLPVTVGSLTLPTEARLGLHKIEQRTFQPGEWVPIVDLPSGDGLVYMTAIQASSRSSNYWEVSLLQPNMPSLTSPSVSSSSLTHRTPAPLLTSTQFRIPARRPPFAGLLSPIHAAQSVFPWNRPLNGHGRFLRFRLRLRRRDVPLSCVRLHPSRWVGWHGAQRLPLPRGGSNRLLGGRAIRVAHRCVRSCVGALAWVCATGRATGRACVP